MPSRTGPVLAPVEPKTLGTLAAMTRPSAISMPPEFVFVTPRRSDPRPNLMSLPKPDRSPANSASTSAKPLPTLIAWLNAPKSSGFWKVSLCVASALPRSSEEPSGTKPWFPKRNRSGVDEPPKLTLRSAPYAAKPPFPLNSILSFPAPKFRLKFSTPSPKIPPSTTIGLVPPVLAMPPGMAF